MVSEQYVIDFVRHHADLFSRVKPSFFEMTVAMAFKYFADSQVDIAVIEVDWVDASIPRTLSLL